MLTALVLAQQPLYDDPAVMFSMQTQTLMVVTHVILYQLSSNSTYVWFPIILVNNFLRGILLHKLHWYDALTQTGLMGFLLALVCVR